VSTDIDNFIPSDFYDALQEELAKKTKSLQDQIKAAEEKGKPEVAARAASQKSLDVLDQSMNCFVEAFGQIKNIQLVRFMNSVQPGVM